MSSIRQYLLDHRLLPQQIIRLDGKLFGRLEAVAVAQERTVHDLVIEVLNAAVYENYSQAKNDRRWGGLTPREQQVVALICLGYTNREIAAQFVISINTVRSHTRKILEKYQVASKTELRLILANWDFDAWLEEIERG